MRVSRLGHWADMIQPEYGWAHWEYLDAVYDDMGIKAELEHTEVPGIFDIMWVLSEQAASAETVFRACPAAETGAGEGDGTGEADTAGTSYSACSGADSTRLDSYDATQCMLAHWEAGDRPVLAEVASTEAISQMFEVEWEPPVTDADCRSEHTEWGDIVCDVWFVGDWSLQTYLDEESDGVYLNAVGVYSNPPGWYPNH